MEVRCKLAKDQSDRLLGAGAYVEAGIQVKDRVRVAIQRAARSESRASSRISR
jgi:hypothetical protein